MTPSEAFLFLENSVRIETVNIKSSVINTLFRCKMLRLLPGSRLSVGARLGYWVVLLVVSLGARAEMNAGARAADESQKANNHSGSNSLNGVVSVTRVVGEVGNGVHIVTSREVRINLAIEEVLVRSPESKTVELKILTGREKDFASHVWGVLDEWAVVLEAGTLSRSNISKSEVSKAMQTVQTELLHRKDWQALEVASDEMRQLVERKLTAREFIKLKSDPSLAPVSDEEVLVYFKKNRLRFGSLPLSVFKENIREFLIKQKTERRLDDWHEVLRRKYRLRNFIAG